MPLPGYVPGLQPKCVQIMSETRSWSPARWTRSIFVFTIYRLPRLCPLDGTYDRNTFFCKLIKIDFLHFISLSRGWTLADLSSCPDVDSGDIILRFSKSRTSTRRRMQKLPEFTNHRQTRSLLFTPHSQFRAVYRQHCDIKQYLVAE